MMRDSGSCINRRKRNRGSCSSSSGIFRGAGLGHHPIGQKQIFYHGKIGKHGLVHPFVWALVVSENLPPYEILNMPLSSSRSRGNSSNNSRDSSSRGSSSSSSRGSSSNSSSSNNNNNSYTSQKSSKTINLNNSTNCSTTPSPKPNTPASNSRPAE